VFLGNSKFVKIEKKKSSIFRQFGKNLREDESDDVNDVTTSPLTVISQVIVEFIILLFLAARTGSRSLV
jgi:hypothetical protein